MRASQVELVVKNPPANAGDLKDVGSIPVSGKIPWRRAWQPTPVFLPGESYGQRSLVGCSPWGRKESDTTEAPYNTHTVKKIVRRKTIQNDQIRKTCGIIVEKADWNIQAF